MRDQLDSQMWVENHDQFALLVDDAIAALRAGLVRLGQWDGTTHQLLALIASFVITGLTFNTTAVT
ncbi:MAG TPA: hypothetical protein VJS15_07940 [Allosphingosinicella sp.]|nr:hypothetical protein [Allosphingosinicella sp.]